MKKGLFLAFALLTASVAALADRNHPGFVNFDSLKALRGQQAVVRLDLDGWLLGLAKQAAKESGDEDAEFLRRIDSVQVRIFELDGDIDDVRDDARALADDLFDQGWESMASINDKGSMVQVMVKGSEEGLDGITIMAMDNGSEAVFVNIRGHIRSEDVARIINSKDLIHADLDIQI